MLYHPKTVLFITTSKHWNVHNLIVNWVFAGRSYAGGGGGETKGAHASLCEKTVLCHYNSGGENARIQKIIMYFQWF